MDVKVLATARAIGDTLSEELGTCVGLHGAVAWGSNGHLAFDKLLLVKTKIRKLTVGTFGAQTHPDFIEKFVGHSSVRFVEEEGELFHHKAYVFDHPGGHWHAVIGSANFTRAGLLSNDESAVLIRGDSKEDSAYVDLCEVVDRAWKRGRTVDADWLGRYRIRYADRAWHAEPLGTSNAKRNLSSERGRSWSQVSFARKTWPEYLKSIRRVVNPGAGDLEARLGVLSAARKIFEKRGSLVAMPAAERKAICGLVPDSGQPEDDTPWWACFGTTVRAVVFKAIYKDKRFDRLSQALDQIPLEGRVLVGHYAAFLKDLGGMEGIGLGVATRLMAMKRPDTFVCLNRANTGEFKDIWGLKRTRLDLQTYYDEIVGRIQTAVWYGHSRPQGGQDEAIWRGRVALLDMWAYVDKV